MSREGSLEAPTRHALDWKNPEFYNEEKLLDEMERVFDICHGCRRCVSLCESFPTLFDLVDESDTMEIDGVDRKDYWKVVDHCYLCDLCFLTKCPYVPPHEWNLDFPHLMLQAKAVRYKQEGASFRDKTLTNTDSMGTFAGIPVISGVVNKLNKTPAFRNVLESSFGVHKDAVIPEFHSNKLRNRVSNDSGQGAEEAGPTKGKVVLFATCYGNNNDPQTGEDLVSVFRHNGIQVRFSDKEKCCGMPKLELGDLESVDQAKNVNIPELARLVDEGWDIVAPIPSCVLMFKQELPLMYPNDAQVKKVQEAIYDPFEYLMLRHKHGMLKTEFKNPLGNVSYHVACHQRVQRIGMKTRDMLQLVPDTEVNAIERCSGHDGTYAVKKEFHEYAVKIARPVVNKVVQGKPDHFTSDCVMAGHHIADGVCRKEPGSELAAEHPISLIRKAYGI
jgi:glycerol-3-phosphate dehydrogenase subunit C